MNKQGDNRYSGQRSGARPAGKRTDTRYQGQGEGQYSKQGESRGTGERTNGGYAGERSHDGRSNDRYAGKRWDNKDGEPAGRTPAGEKPAYKKQYSGNSNRGDGAQRSYNKSDRSDGAQRSYNKPDRGDGAQRSYNKPDRGDGAQRSYNKSDRGDGAQRSYNKPDRSDGAQRSYNKSNRNDEAYNRRYEKRPTDADRPQTADAATAQAGGADELPFLIIGRNAVREAIKASRSIDRILVSSEQDGSLREIVNLARDAKLVLREVDRKKLDELCMPFGHGGKTANHQGIIAYAAGMEYCTVADILHAAKEKGEEPFVIVLDGVEDPHNLGSIIRSAECAGAHGVVIGKRRSASVTAAAVKAAAGATAYMRVARVVNVSGAIEELKRAGQWAAGADMGGTPVDKQGLNGALALVIGGEGGGLSKLVRETCDFLVSIPMQGQINSLNASVAAAILMFEKRRQDAIKE